MRQEQSSATVTDPIPTRRGAKPPVKRGGDGRGSSAKKGSVSPESRGGRPAPLDIKAAGKAGKSKKGQPKPPGGSSSGSRSSGGDSSQSSVVISRSPASNVKFFIGVNDQDKLCLEYGLQHSWNVKKSKAVKWNGHSISAMSRDAAVLDILVRESKGKSELRVLDWFGSPRNCKFVRAIRNCVITWVCAPDDAIGGDASRTVKNARISLEDEDQFDVVIVQDVYQFGPKPTDRLGPEGIKKILEYSSSGHCYVLARMFNGLAGADIYGNGKPEMVWYRQGGLVIASPEPRGQWYAPHPDINWVQYRTHGGIDSSELGQYGPYSLFRLAKTRAGAQALVPQELPPGIVTEMFIRGPGVEGWVYYWWNRVFGVGSAVHLATYTLLGSKYAMKVPSGQILDAAEHAVQESVIRDPEMAFLHLRDPRQFDRICEGTKLAVLYGKRTKGVSTYLGLRSLHVKVEEDLIKLRGSSLSGVGPTTWLTLGSVLAAAGLLALGGRRVLGFVQQLKNTYGIMARAACVGLLPSPSGKTCIAEYNELDFEVLTRNTCIFTGVMGFVEELFGWKFPKSKLVLACVEAYLYVQMGVPPLQRIAPFMIHVTNYVLSEYAGSVGKSLGLVDHVGWNVLVTYNEMTEKCKNWPRVCPQMMTCTAALPWKPWVLPGAVMGYFVYKSSKVQVDKKRWREFADLHKQGLLVEANSAVVSPIPPGTVLPSYQSKLQFVDWPIRGSMHIKVDGEPCDVNTALELLDEGVGKNVMYPVLITNRLLWQPANTEKNLLVALVTRTHYNPFEGRDDEAQRHSRWAAMGKWMVDASVFAGNELVQYTLEESAALMGTRGKRLLAAGKVDEELGPMHLKKSVSLKWDETITARKMIGGVLTMKCRPIINLDPIFHSRMAPMARSCSDHLHRVFNGNIWTIGGVAMRIHYAAGYDQERLSRMSADFQGEVACFGVSGDDSIAYIPGLGYIEADQGAFDHSQDDGPVKHFGFQWMRQAQLPPEFIAHVYECCTKKYAVRKHRIEIKGVAGTQMPTGITMTTNINSVNTIGMYVYFLVERVSRPHLTLEAAGHELGLKVKVFSRESFGQLTFLKGWWRQEVDGELFWVPLPSACLKLGKVLRDPVEITKVIKHTRGQRKVDRDTMEIALRKVAHCLARSYGCVPLDYPIFGAFVSCLLRCGVDPGRPLGYLEESWKPKMSCLVVIDREEAITAIMERYSVERSWIVEVEAAFKSINTLPVYVEHVLFDHLCTVDY